MRKHRRSINNSSSREKLPKRAFSVLRAFCETVAAKTCLIIALYYIFSEHLISEYPFLKRAFGRFLRKRAHRQIEGGIRINLEKAILNSEKSKHLQLAELRKKHGSKIIEADGYVDNFSAAHRVNHIPTAPTTRTKRGDKGKKS